MRAWPMAPNATLSSSPVVAGGWSTRSIYVLGFLTVIGSFNHFDRSVLSLVLPLVKAELGLSDTVLGFVSSLTLVYAVVGIPVAALADRWSRRNVLMIGFFFWSLMTALTGFSALLWQLILCRLLMGVGESAGVAPANSMLSEIFSRERLPLAIAIFTLSSSLAAIVYTPIAGWIADDYGWRPVFLVAGVAGMVLAVLFGLTVREARQGTASGTDAQGAAEPQQAVTIRDAIRFLLGSRAYVYFVVGASFMGAYLYGTGAWTATFLVRVHGMTYSEVGFYLGPVRGGIAAAGILTGGIVANWLGRRDERWRGWTPALACLLLAPAEALFVFADDQWLWLTGLSIAALFAVMYQPPVIAGLLSVARPGMRSVAISFSLLCSTLLGQFVGPVLIGGINDWLSVGYGPLAVRYSLGVVILCAVIAGFCFFMAARHIGRDTARALAQEPNAKGRS